jgi:large subunit ribosomal protein L18
LQFGDTMKIRKLKNVRHLRRKKRIRSSIFGTPEKPRLTVSRSLNNISVQLIDDINGRTLCSASSNAKDLREQVKNGGNCTAATVIGQKIAERARMQGIKQVAFDRNGRRYHGRIKALAESARKTGLVF